MLQISRNVQIPLSEVDIQAVRAAGPGGQNVNKVATAIHLRFAVQDSSLPDFYKNRLLGLHDRRLTRDGVIVIKAQRYRSQEKNREDGLERLRELIRSVAVVRKKRQATKPTRSSQKKRLDSKTLRSRLKTQRGKIIDGE